jgi:hypothetical protein
MPLDSGYSAEALLARHKLAIFRHFPTFPANRMKLGHRHAENPEVAKARCVDFHGIDPRARNAAAHAAKAGVAAHVPQSTLPGMVQQAAALVGEYSETELSIHPSGRSVIAASSEAV